MFQQTLRKLTGINSVVFLILFVVFGGIIMGITSYRLFDRVDDSMVQVGTAFRVAGGRVTFQPRLSRMVLDPRSVLIIRTTNGGLVHPFPSPNDAGDSSLEIAAMTVPSAIKTIKYGGHVYRTLSIPYVSAENVLTVNNELFEVREVIMVTNVDAETALLGNLLKVILAGLVIGTTAIFLAGYFLARRAIIPIQAAWDKQQQFVADASHELRTPLTVIQSNAELILRHPDNTVEQESRYVSTILRETMRMNKLVATLLTLARADANLDEIHMAAVNISDLVEAVAEQFALMAELKGVIFQTECSPSLELIGDRERLHQLIVILLDNALKFTGAGGRVELKAFEKAGGLQLEVKDTGCGIPSEDLPRVFDRFFRSDKSRSREVGGTGLGLAIARWIIDKHGGKIKVESQVGIGTTFYILLPMRQS